MADNSRALETSATPERVWATWSDTSTWPSWNPDIETVSLDGPLADGAAGTMTTKSGGKHNIQIVDVRAGREFSLISDLPMPATKVRFRCLIEPADGGSRVSQAVSVTGLLAPLMGGMITGRIVPSFEPLLQGLKNHVEATA
jgi:uncharacterized protein YndB with AHSA1/START domain